MRAGRGRAERRLTSARMVCRARRWDGVSADAKQLLRGLLTVDPDQRLTAAQAATHPWIETCGGALADMLADEAEEEEGAEGGAEGVEVGAAGAGGVGGAAGAGGARTES